MILQKVFLAGMALGLLGIVQPWSETIFACGFPTTLLSIIGYNVAGWMSCKRI